MIKRIVRALTFEMDGSVSVEYVTPAIDQRNSGLVVNHVIFIPSHHVDLEGDRMDLVTAAHKLLDASLEVFAAERDQVPPEQEAPTQLTSGPFDNPEDEQRYGTGE